MPNWFEAILSPLLSGLVGAAVVYYFGIRRLAVERRSTYIERQLTEFYAPLAGLRKQIRAKSELRERIAAAAGAAWADLSRERQGQLDHEAQFGPFRKIIEYDNQQLALDLLPKYCKMLDLFTERYHLAASETQPYYQPFLEFVEIWKRCMSDALPADVIERLHHSEHSLNAFYDHLDEKMQQLQAEIARG